MDAEEAVVSQTHQRPPTPPAKPYFNLKKETKGYVGIDTLQEQIRKKVIKRGFEFNIIVVGKQILFETRGCLLAVCDKGFAK